MPVSSYRFHPAADLELSEAAEWYAAQRSGLGLEFMAAVRTKIFEVLEAPQRWRMVDGTRRVLLGRFPYALVYRERPNNEVEIVAVAHLKRRPKYWQGR